MQGSVITLDVSKGSCHYQGFIKKNQPSTKTRILKFTKKSFAELSAYRERLAIKAGQEDIPFILKQQVYIINLFRNIWTIMDLPIT